MRHKWIVSDPKFESDLVNSKLKTAYWEGHRDFAYDFLRFVNPGTLVELGSQYGCSIFSFCQAKKDFKLRVQINAVDYWKGDIGAVDDGEAVFQMVNQIKDKYFSELNLRLYPMDFDSALSEFDDNSVDILHIDGGHKYEDVDHDFNTWLPKLKENGIILFHDVYSDIDQGSCDHWKYICEHYNVYFDFTHSCGLGVLFPKGDYWYKALEESGFFHYYKDLYYYRSRFKYLEFRFEELSHLYEDRYEGIKMQSRMIDERDQTIKNQTGIIDERDQTIKAQTGLIDERDQTIKVQAELIDERDQKIVAQDKLIEEYYVKSKDQEARIAQSDEKIIVLNDKITASSKQLAKETRQCQMYSDFIQSRWDIRYRWNKTKDKREKR